MRIVRPALLLAPATFFEDTRRWLADWGIDRAVAEHDTPAIFDWILPLVAFQGIGDTAAVSYAAQHARVTWKLIDAAMRSPPSCPRLRSHWHFANCHYRKARSTCAEPGHMSNCFVPSMPLRKGSLNQAAASLYLFLRDVCGGDFVGWLDARLAAADPGVVAPGGGRTMAAAVLDPLCNVVGTGPKLWSMILADLLLAADPSRERWVAAGAAMVAIDSLVHNYLARTGILSRFGAVHPYGLACHAPGGCADIIGVIAAHVDAREFNPAFPPCFPRFVEKAVWHFCAEAGRNICNGRRIDDRVGCQQVFCPAYGCCERVTISAAELR